MAINLQRFVITATTVVAAGTITTPVAGEPGTGGAAGYGNTSISAGAEDWPMTFLAGTPIVLDSGTPSALYTALNTASALRAYVPGQDDVGHAAISN
jgi:hypothetical protein